MEGIFQILIPNKSKNSNNKGFRTIFFKLLEAIKVLPVCLTIETLIVASLFKKPILISLEINSDAEINPNAAKRKLLF